MKKFISAFILRFLPAQQPSAVVVEARESMRRAWESVANRLPAQFPTLTLPKMPVISMPKITLPVMPSLVPQFGRFFSGLSTLVLAQGQLQSFAVFCHVVAGDMAEGPVDAKIELADAPTGERPDRSGMILTATPADQGQAGLTAAVTRRQDLFAQAGTDSIAICRAAVGAPGILPDSDGENLPAARPTGSRALADCWLRANERSQRPPPVVA